MASGREKRSFSIFKSFRPKGWMMSMRAFLPGGRKHKSEWDASGAFSTLGDVAVGLLLSAGVAFLFYRSLWGMIAAVFLVPFWHRMRRMQRDGARTRQVRDQFLSAMQMVSGSLKAGYSMENAWRMAGSELDALYGDDAPFCVAVRKMNRRLEVNEPLEKILAEYAADSGVEDILQFAEVFGYAKRSGGDLTEIIRSVTERMQEKAEILSEIEAAVSSQKMEMRMMDFLLPGILLFVTISSSSYITALYHNPMGICVMSVCLGGYIGCIFWSEKLTDIRV